MVIIDYISILKITICHATLSHIGSSATAYNYEVSLVLQVLVTVCLF
jgi:hypothetical protein